MGRLARIRGVWDRCRASCAATRGRLLDALTPGMAIRVTIVVAGGVAIALALGEWIRPGGFGSPWWLGMLVMVLIAAFAAWEGLRFLQRLLVWWPTGRAGRRLRLVLAGLALAGVVWWIVAIGPGAAWSAVTDTAVSTLPASFVVVFGGWAVLLVRRRVARSRHRWLRYATDLVFMAALGAFLLFVFERDTLLTRPVAGVLIPVGV
jgi:hypothetical protein